MKKIFCRIGSKTSISKKIIKLIPEHAIYIEPFVGSGAVYFKKKPSKKEILNDLDKELMNSYKFIKTATQEQVNKYKGITTLEKFNKIKNETGGDHGDKLARYIIKSCNTFGSTGYGKIYKLSDPFAKLKNLKKYQERLKNTSLLNKDYKFVIKKYDDKNVFFYLDPPYEGSVKFKLYKKSEFNYIELSNILKKIKGKFILSLNDSKNIRNLFESFNINTIITPKKPSSSIGRLARNELLIFNYSLQ